MLALTTILYSNLFTVQLSDKLTQIHVKVCWHKSENMQMWLHLYSANWKVAQKKQRYNNTFTLLEPNFVSKSLEAIVIDVDSYLEHNIFVNKTSRSDESEIVAIVLSVQKKVWNHNNFKQNGKYSNKCDWWHAKKEAT